LSTSAGDDALLVNVQAREAGSFGAGGNDDVLSAQGLLPKKMTVIGGGIIGLEMVCTDCGLSFNAGSR
jgi:pyruvate/2-oxoglutarate dehydrogenase complex dihydrolipoamide dehydrogenase (E3) component